MLQLLPVFILVMLLFQTGVPSVGCSKLAVFPPYMLLLQASLQTAMMHVHMITHGAPGSIRPQVWVHCNSVLPCEAPITKVLKPCRWDFFLTLLSQDA